jgi:hypothetical protein
VVARIAGQWSRKALDEEDDALVLGVELTATSELIGDVMVRWVSAPNSCGEIGFVFDPTQGGSWLRHTGRPCSATHRIRGLWMTSGHRSDRGPQHCFSSLGGTAGNARGSRTIRKPDRTAEQVLPQAGAQRIRKVARYGVLRKSSCSTPAIGYSDSTGIQHLRSRIRSRNQPSRGDDRYFGALHLESVAGLLLPAVNPLKLLWIGPHDQKLRMN